MRRVGHRLDIDLGPAADDDVTVVPPGQLDRVLDTPGHEHAVGGPAGLAGDDDVGAVRQRPPDPLVGDPSHHDRVTGGGGAEVLQVSRNVPRHVLVPADHTVLGDGGDHHHVLVGHTAMGALIPGCGS